MDKRIYNVHGHISFEKDVADTEKLNPKVYARIGHRTLASAPVDAKGEFDLKFERMGKIPPHSLTLIVGPPVSESMLRHNNTKQISISSDEWIESGDMLSLEKGKLRGLIINYPEISLGMLKSLSLRLRHTTQQMSDSK